MAATVAQHRHLPVSRHQRMSASVLYTRVLFLLLVGSAAQAQDGFPILQKTYRIVGSDVQPLTAAVHQAINSSLAQFLSLGNIGFTYNYFDVSLPAPVVDQPNSSWAGGNRHLLAASPFGGVDVNFTVFVTDKSVNAPSGAAERTYEKLLEDSMAGKGYQVHWLALGFTVIRAAAQALANAQFTPLEATQYVIQVSGTDVAPFGVEKQSLLLLSLAQLRVPGDGVAWTRVLSVSETPAVSGANSSANVTLVMTRQTNSNLTLQTTLAQLTGVSLEGLLGAAGLPARVRLLSSAPAAHETLQDQVKDLLAPTAPSPAPAPQPAVAVQPPPALRVHQQVDKGLIGGLVAGSVVFALLLAAGVLQIVRQRRVGMQDMRGSVDSDAPSDLTKNDLLLPMRYSGGVVRQGGGSSGNTSGNTKSPDMGSNGSSLNSDSTIASVQGWELSSLDIEICQRPDGKIWVLGEGSFGQVFKAKRNGVQFVAVKVLAKADPYMVKLFHKEIQILKSLSFDRNIVQFYGACLEPHNSMLVLEYMEGGDLREALSSDVAAQLQWYQKGRTIALDVAAGLHFLHQHKVIHSDLKSKNILLTKDFTTAKIADVGLARIISTEYTSQMQLAGTFAYAAPELLLGERMDEKADIYSFGVVLWELCSQEVAMRGQLRAVKVPEECPARIAQLIDDCLQRAPEGRPSAKQIYDTISRMPAAGPPPRRQSFNLSAVPSAAVGAPAV